MIELVTPLLPCPAEVAEVVVGGDTGFMEVKRRVMPETESVLASGLRAR